jgi:uncharacterized protein (DUF1499 family)
MLGPTGVEGSFMAERNGDKRERRARRAASLTLAAVALAVIALVGVALSGPIHRLGLLGARWALGLFGLSALLGFAAAVLAVSGIGLALIARAWRSVAGSGLALLVAFAATGPLLIMVRTAAAVPVIHDITTDTESPPQWVALQPSRAASENGTAYGGIAVASQQKRAYRDLAPLVLALPPDRAFARAEAAARALGWHIVAAAPAEGRLEASDTTLWFGFTDDIVVRVRPAPQGSRIDVRSASRVGRSDLGVNARRIRSFLAAVARPGSR